MGVHSQYPHNVFLIYTLLKIPDVVSSELKLVQEFSPNLSDSTSEEFKNLSGKFCGLVGITLEIYLFIYLHLFIHLQFFIHIYMYFLFIYPFI